MKNSEPERLEEAARMVMIPDDGEPASGRGRELGINTERARRFKTVLRLSNAWRPRGLNLYFPSR